MYIVRLVKRNAFDRSATELLFPLSNPVINVESIGQVDHSLATDVQLDLNIQYMVVLLIYEASVV